MSKTSNIAKSIKLHLTQNALRVLERRYLMRDDKGNVMETPEELFWRVASSIAKADLNYDPHADVEATASEFFEIMANLDFLPNSPTLMNAGRKLGQLAACFVLPIEDSMESIFETIKNTALIHKSGGGTGFSFSRLRPQNDVVQSTRGVSSGPVSFMNVFDAATEAIKQGGTRRGANMAVLRVDHPDILDFITVKKDLSKLTNFNISVAATNEFMQKVLKREDYDLINPRTGKPTKKLNAREVFDLITETAWLTGDPGIVFIDRINRDNPTPQLGEIESTNPCGEQPLLPYESCNLGSINLANMVTDTEINFDKLRYVVRKSVHFLDNVIDVNKYPIPEIEKMTKGNRKIGLGIMGFADMLIRMGIPYDSEEALEIGEKVMKFISEQANQMSIELAESRGEFPNFKGSIYDKPGGPKFRNATRTTIAPTGTISIIAGVSSGIEPIFAVVYVRHVMDNDQLLEVHPLFEKIAKEEGFYSDELMKTVAEHGSTKGISEIPERIQRLFVTSHDVSPEWHIRIQAAFQKYTDNAVSKTVNFPRHATVEDVRKVYLLAYELNCKGVTIYRDGSREAQVLTKGASIQKAEAKVPEERVLLPGQATKRERPPALKGKTIRMETGCGPLYVTINEDEYGLFEVFNTMGKAGGCVASQTEAIGRLISLALRSGVSTEAIIKQLIGISCHKPYGFGAQRILSCADAVAKAIKIYLEEKSRDGQKGSQLPLFSFDEEYHLGLMGAACPECGSTLEFGEGCAVCRVCGYSECG
ncbi:ribonucleotide-diphosphate reductase subunit alpha [candidate division KSB1 bacterium]|nr:MAG: ribonucleotide-diphosphate reductase subunit alpha [candidate division KSB1 bacterium]